MDDISLIKVDKYRSRRNMYLILLIIFLKGVKGSCVNERYVQEKYVIFKMKNDSVVACKQTNGVRLFNYIMITCVYVVIYGRFFCYLS